MAHRSLLALAGFFLLAVVDGRAQMPQPLPALTALKGSIPAADSALPVIRQRALASEPYSVTGLHGAVLGQQDGSAELWLYPSKIFNRLSITARMDNYATPIAVNQFASSIEVRPEVTVITYAHANFTLRQFMMAPQGGTNGAAIFFTIDAVRPVTLTFSMMPQLARMWPAPNTPPVSFDWVPAASGTGFFLLEQQMPGEVAALAMPSAGNAPQRPYQEHEVNEPLQFVLRFDPAHDRGRIYPLLAVMAQSAAQQEPHALMASLIDANARLLDDLRATQQHYKNLLASSTSIRTPNVTLDEAYRWAVVSMEQLQVETGSTAGEKAYTAGVLESSDSLRPGYGWFFGRDALWTLYAINSLGEFTRTRDELEFLMRRQSPEGKILHEWSQTADLVNWRALPYGYAEADATLLLQMVMRDYLRTSGDLEFVRKHWPELELAWKFESTHDADGDGIYDNAQGTGWIESWPGGMPKQEIYLAALDVQSSRAFAELAQATGHAALAASAEKRAAAIAPRIEQEYLLPDKGFYGFSWNAARGLDAAPTIFPAVAWWDGNYSLKESKPLFDRWASSEFSTDWGTRLVGEGEKFYDPISYHQGSVWPLFTGWASLAEYRAGRALSGYAHLMQNANLTWAQDAGNQTEVLSGAFYKPLQCSSAHQLWSSAMVVSPVLRGLFGVAWDEPRKTLLLAPHLPATWNEAAVDQLPLGADHIDLRFTRHRDELLVEAAHLPAGVQLSSPQPGARVEGARIHLPLPAVEVAIEQPQPELGADTTQLKVMDEVHQAHGCTLEVEGLGGRSYTLAVRENLPVPGLHVEGAQLGELYQGMRTMTIHFDGGAGYQRKSIHLSW